MILLNREGLFSIPRASQFSVVIVHTGNKRLEVALFEYLGLVFLSKRTDVMKIKSAEVLSQRGPAISKRLQLNISEVSCRR